MHIHVPGGHVFDPDDLAMLSRAFALAAAAGASGRARDLAARSLFAAFAAGERDVVVLADHARLRLVQGLTVVRLKPGRSAATV